MKKELKSGRSSADKSAAGWPTVGGVNVIAVLQKHIKSDTFEKNTSKVTHLKKFFLTPYMFITVL